jgi:F-type H+-transporting ATPase subunit delta
MAELTIDLTYGTALFEVASELNKVDVILEEIQAVNKIFEENPSFYEFFITPRISKAEKKEAVKEIFSGKISPELVNFLFILLDKRRTTYFKQIVRQYKKTVSDSRNISEGMVVSVTRLKEGQLIDLQTKAAILLKKQIKLENKVDTSIIGGVKIFVGDKVIDATVKSKLQSLKESLDAVIV